MHRRLWIAALLSVALIAWLQQDGETPAAAFSLGFPLLILSGGGLWRRLQGAEQTQGRGVSLLALLFLAPVVATRSWNEINASDWMQYIAPIDHVVASVIQASAVLSGVGVFLGFVALTLLIIGRHDSLILVGGLLAACVASIWVELQLDAAVAALQNRDVELAQAHVRWTGWHAVFAILPGALVGCACWVRMGGVWNRSEWFGHLLALAVVAWVVRPPLPNLLQVSKPLVEVDVPQTGPGISVPMPALNPWASDFMEQATQRGASPREKEWGCSGRDKRQWLAIPRLSVAVAVESEKRLSELDAVLGRLYAKSIHRVHLIGRAEPKPGPLKQALSYPTVPFILAAPPVESFWVALSKDKVDWVFGGRPTGDDAICVVLPMDDPTIGVLYEQGRQLLEEEGCRALSLIPQPWRSQLEFPLSADPGCATKGDWPNQW